MNELPTAIAAILESAINQVLRLDPDTVEQMQQLQGKVIAVGKGKILENGKVSPLIVKKGDRILFGKYAGTDIKIDGEEHLIMREDDILAIIK